MYLLSYHGGVRSEVLRYIRKRGLMRAGDRVAVAVSGGADSVALLRVLLDLRSELGVVLGVAHFNHGLRGKDSEADEAFVAGLARQYGLGFFSGNADVRTHALNNKLSLEAAGRELRYTWLKRIADEQAFDSVATAHTLDDQAETVLLKLLRGAGTRGLAGIYPSLEIGTSTNFRAGGRSADRARIVRPLLSMTRHEVETYLSALGQSWREDMSNIDKRLARNRLRHELLPLLQHEYNPNIRRVLSDTAELARAEEEYWQPLVARELEMRLGLEGSDAAGGVPTLPESGISGTGHGKTGLSLRNFQHLPLALQRRLLRSFAESEDLALDFEHVERLVRCARGESSKTELAEEWLAFRKGQRLELRPPMPEPSSPGYDYTLPIPGELYIPEIGVTLRATIVLEPLARRRIETDALLSATLLAPVLRVRNWCPGDRFRPVHRRSEEKLKRLFLERRIPAEKRTRWPVVLSGEEIVWVRGFPVARSKVWSGNSNAVTIDATDVTK
jgi:tRNA(Ile)-lysidine synthase